MSLAILRNRRSQLINCMKGVRGYAKIEWKNPLHRTLDTLKADVSEVFGKEREFVYPEHVDVVIIGGGVLGASVAYWLKTKAGRGLSIVVIDKDLSFRDSQKELSLGVLNQHHSLPENIYLSQYSADFYRNLREHFQNNKINIDFIPKSHLILASDKYAEVLEANVAYQKELGIKNELLSPATIQQRYPWINIEDVALGSIGIESEGVINSWKLQKHFVEKSKEMGTTYLQGEVKAFKLEKQRDVLMEGVSPGTFQKLQQVVYETPDQVLHELKFAACILTAGAESTKISEFLGIGLGTGILSVALPVKKRKQLVYSIKAKHSPLRLDSPLLMDSSGLRVARKSFDDTLSCYHVPLESQPPDDEYFDKIIKPSLLNRIPTLEDIKMNNMETEWHDYNSFDDTGVLGCHPYHNNLFIAAGFGMQGYQHAPGIGRALAELIIDSHYVNVDMTRFGFDRFLTGEQLIETTFY